MNERYKTAYVASRTRFRGWGGPKGEGREGRMMADPAVFARLIEWLYRGGDKKT